MKLRKKDIKVGLIVKSKPSKWYDSGGVEVIAYDGGKKVTIKFLESGNIKEMNYSQFLRGGAFDHERFPSKMKPTQCLFRFTDTIYETWYPECGIEGAVRMPVFGSSTGTINNYDKVVGETIVDRWFYDKYKGIVLYTDINNYTLISKDRRNIERFFGVKPNKGLRKAMRLHHFIRGHTSFGDYVVDHISGNRLDNRFCNLRTCTNKENSFNKSKSTSLKNSKHSKYKGVFYNKNRDYLTKTGKQRKCWRAMLTVSNKWYNKWCYTEEEAALAYNELALKHFGEFAKLNVVEG
jgi:hypothetical protein